MTRNPIPPLFEGVLGAALAELPPAVRATHDVRAKRSWSGRAKVTRGHSLWARLIARLFGFPPACDDIAVLVTKTPQAGGELWERRFGDRQFRSFLKAQDGQMTERFGPLTFTLGLHVADDRLWYPVRRGRMGWVPLPKLILPESTAFEYEADGRFHFDVALSAPLTGALMVHYQGWLVPDTAVGGFPAS
ncbi:MAG: DUF4166 domain-containing protein [Yoonia sp.]|uniref:DUF4166 domain-containing protein n=1 Tax=Yoonia sp. TaxID=2212373 RepID=UPI00273F2E83|nr:DUF4166 domain-containing protein [Yoonia sp.]MDP5085748.1 DUF4166 domain-containing protein [Yoonia sp.]MDP5362256.1 DUF4166 domain-containing protein [Paracoccaceae bacterium]